MSTTTTPARRPSASDLRLDKGRKHDVLETFSFGVDRRSKACAAQYDRKR